MPFDSSGTYARYGGFRKWQDDAESDTKIMADIHDSHDQDIANGLSNCITRDNKGGPTTNISWRNNKITNLAPGVDLTDAVNLNQLQSRTSFSDSVTITGSDIKGRIIFTGSQSPDPDPNSRPLGLSFSQAANGLSMFFGTRVSGAPLNVGGPHKFVWNDNASGVGNDMMWLSPNLLTVLGGSANLYLQSTTLTPAAGSNIGGLAWQGRNSANAIKEYARIIVTMDDPINNTEDATIHLQRVVNGSIGQGIAIAATNINLFTNTSVTGNLSASGNVTAGGAVIFANYCYSSIGGPVYFSAGAVGGTVVFRPNGPFDGTGNVTIDPAGSIVSPGNIQGLGMYATYISSSGAIGAATTITASGAIASGGTITALQHFVSSNNQLWLGTTGAGQVVFRPNGSGSGTGQTTIQANGNMAVYGTVSSLAGRFITDGTSIIMAPGSAGTVYMRPNGQDSLTDQCYFNTTNAYKTGGGSWAASSDERVKTVHGAYESGLEQILALEPVRYAYKDSPDTERIGLVAQQAELVMPELVSQETGIIDGVEVLDFRTLDPSALIYAVINAIKDVAGRVRTLEGAPA